MDKYKVILKKGDQIFEIERDNQVAFLNSHNETEVGKEEMKTFPNLDECEGFVSKEVAAKIKDGYVVISDTSKEPLVYGGDSKSDETIDQPQGPVRKNPKAGTSEDVLSKEVMAEIERLGGVVSEEIIDDPEVIDNYEVPQSLMHFFSGLVGKGFENGVMKKYCTEEDSENSYWVWDMNFIWPDSCAETEVQDRGDKVLACFAYADGGNYMLAVDLNDRDLSDPRVYKLDHYDPEQEISGYDVRLSAFLHDLRLEK